MSFLPFQAPLPPDRALPLFLPCAPGFEAFLAAELESLWRDAGEDPGSQLGSAQAPGRNPIQAKLGGVEVLATMSQVFRLALGSRLALGLWLRCAEFPARHFSQLESACRALTLREWIGEAGPVYLKVSTVRSRLFHTKAIAERFFKFSQLSPSLEEDENSVRVMIRIARDKAVVSLDLAGGLLCKRGWRLQTAKAPLRKDLAARLIEASGWRPGRVLLDPMCGSGTMPIEAARSAAGYWPNGRRRFALESFPGWDLASFAALRERGLLQVSEPSAQAPQIFGGDQNAGGLAIARANAERAGVSSALSWEHCRLRDWSAKAWAEPPCVVCNPPFGQRIGDPKRLRSTFAALGAVIQSVGASDRFAIIAPPGPWIDALGLAYELEVRTDFGGTKVALYRAPVSE